MVYAAQITNYNELVFMWFINQLWLGGTTLYDIVSLLQCSIDSCKLGFESMICFFPEEKSTFLGTPNQQIQGDSG